MEIKVVYLTLIYHLGIVYLSPLQTVPKDTAPRHEGCIPRVPNAERQRMRIMDCSFLILSYQLIKAEQ